MPSAAAAAASSAPPHLARNRPSRRPIRSINMACTAACSVGAPRPAAALRCQRSTRVQRAARLVTRAAAGDVLLEVHDLQAKIAATGQQILKGVTLTGECASLAAPGSHAVVQECAARRADRPAAPPLVVGWVAAAGSGAAAALNGSIARAHACSAGGRGACHHGQERLRQEHALQGAPAGWEGEGGGSCWATPRGGGAGCVGCCHNQF